MRLYLAKKNDKIVEQMCRVRKAELAMNTRNKTNESISLLADGEVSDAQIDAALAALESDEGRAEWAIYHQIGDALRSDELVLQMRAEFLPDLFARLEQEPVLIAPVAVSAPVPVATAPTPTFARRFALPGMVAAAAAAFALFGGSQLMVAQKAPVSLPAAATAMVASATSTPGKNAHSATSNQDELLRDPDIDQYLLAHQRFSPSLTSTAQFARSPALANDSEK